MSIEDELMEEAVNAPSRYYLMLIHDNKIDKTYRIDQTLDSNITGEVDDLNRVINMIAIARDHFAGKKYEDLFKDRPLRRIRLGEFDIYFDGVEGKDAYTLMIRYFNVFLNSLDKVGALSWGAKKEPNV